jgi:hypothetical protein
MAMTPGPSTHQNQVEENRLANVLEEILIPRRNVIRPLLTIVLVLGNHGVILETKERAKGDNEPPSESNSNCEIKKRVEKYLPCDDCTTR